MKRVLAAALLLSGTLPAECWAVAAKTVLPLAARSAPRPALAAAPKLAAPLRAFAAAPAPLAPAHADHHAHGPRAAHAAPAARPEAPALPVAPAPLASLFDGSLAPATQDEPVEAALQTARERKASKARFTGRLARWSGAAALWSIYRDGVQLPREAERLADGHASPLKRAAAARKLGVIRRPEALPALAAAAEDDRTPRVRRIAKASIAAISSSSKTGLVRALQGKRFAGARQEAAAMLGRIVRHEKAERTVEALARAAASDPSEDVRLAAIAALAGAASPKAAEALAEMRAQETRPHMVSSLELALASADLEEAGAHEGEEESEALLQALSYKRALSVGVVFTAVELAAGALTGSVALMADATHMLGDQVVTAAALLSNWASRRPPNSRKTFGHLKAEALVGLFGSAAIGFMGFEMATEAWARLSQGAAEPMGMTVAAFALVSWTANSISAKILHHHGHDLGAKSAHDHARLDALGSIAVFVSAVASMLFGWTWVGPAAVALIVGLIAKTVWELGRPAVRILVDAAPEGVDLDDLETDLLAVPGAVAVSGLHVWALNSRTMNMMVRLTVKPGTDLVAARAAAKAAAAKYGVTDSAVEIEPLPR